MSKYLNGAKPITQEQILTMQLEELKADKKELLLALKVAHSYMPPVPAKNLVGETMNKFGG